MFSVSLCVFSGRVLIALSITALSKVVEDLSISSLKILPVSTHCPIPKPPLHF